ncbi:hypothetical protein HGA92_03275 [Candidatus Gracilibacteria bacterium]|nr:hypothetical protein [Candidatus Gracilibacteria bacterium]NUJ99119.1 hypothetical protein [Candidatus Gracilibacteria bacterium]
MKNPIIKDYIKKLKDSLEENNFDMIDYLLEYAISGDLSEEEREEIDELINEATLYLELRDEEYKEEALKIIENLEKLYK